jgi:hypothetical protein
MRVDKQEPVVGRLGHEVKRNDEPMRRASVIALPLSLIATTLTGCGLFGGSSSLDDALEVVPGSVTEVTFFDREAVAERFELDDVDGDSSEAEITEYVEKAQEFPFGTELDTYLFQMLEDASFSALDIDWEVTGYEGDDGFGRVWKMRDGLDLDEVADDLVDAGYEREQSGDTTTLTIGLDEIDQGENGYFVTMLTVALVPDEHLIVTGPLAVDVLDVVADDADSAVDTEAFEDLVDSTDDAEVAVLARDDAACSLGTGRPASEQAEAIELDALGHPEQTGFFVHGNEGDARSVLAFDDEEAAEEDAQAREDFLADGTSRVSGVPSSEFGDWEIEADGDQVRIDIEYDDPRSIPAVISRRDYLSVCAPDGG